MLDMKKQVQTDIFDNVAKNGVTELLNDEATFGRNVWYPDKSKRGKGEGI